MLYRTTLTNGTATATVATILTGPKSTGDKLVAFADAEDGVNTTCADSYLYYTNTTTSSITLGPETTLLDSGATVVVPDYEGPNSAFSAGRQEGMGLLDGIRAALNYAPAGISKNATVGGYGYSGGATAIGAYFDLFRHNIGLILDSCRLGCVTAADLCSRAEHQGLGIWRDTRQFDLYPPEG